MHACIREKKGRKRFEEEGIEEIASHDSKRNNRKKPKQRSREATIRLAGKMVSETGQSWCKNRAPQCQVSKFPAVTGQGSASPVLRGWSQERKGQVSV